MSEIVLHKAIVAPSLALAATALPGWVGPLLVTVLGLALLGFYLKRLLFTPVEEAVLVPEARSLREALRAGAVSATQPKLLRFPRLT